MPTTKIGEEVKSFCRPDSDSLLGCSVFEFKQGIASLRIGTQIT
jgi:hypothetical protein